MCKVAAGVFIAFCLASCLAGYCFGRASNPVVFIDIEYPFYPAPITVEQAIEYLREASAAHQYFVDSPEICNYITGTPEENAIWVERYAQIENVILRLTGG